MKDPKYKTAWSDSLAVLVRAEETSTPHGSNTRPNPPIDDKTSAEDKMLSGCEIIHSSSTTIDALCNLPATGLVLLLTPVLRTQSVPRLSKESRPQMDPFEVLGRNISRRHTRVRHVPYVPKIGLTDTHLAFTREADAVIVVTCASSPPDQVHIKEKGRAIELPASPKSLCKSSGVPMILAKFGDSPKNDNETIYDVVVKASRMSDEVFEKITCLLFGLDT